MKTLPAEIDITSVFQVIVKYIVIIVIHTGWIMNTLNCESYYEHPENKSMLNYENDSINKYTTLISPSSDDEFE